MPRRQRKPITSLSMLPYRLLAAKLLLTASLVWVSACETSTGSLISEDVQDLLHSQQENSGSTFDTPASNVINDALAPSQATSPPLVTSVSPTITIRGGDLVLLIHGENLSNRLSVHLDNDAKQCQVSELGNTTNGIVQTNLIEAACATRGISNRVVSVIDASGSEISGSPITFTGTSVTVSTTSSVSNSLSNTISSLATSLPSEASAKLNPFVTSTASTASTANPDRVIQARLSTPTNLQRVGSTEVIDITWDTIERALGYSVYVSNATNPQPGVRGTTTYITHAPSIQITDFDINQTQYIVVKAFSNNTESAGSAELQVDVQPKLRTPYGVQTQISKQAGHWANQGVYFSDEPSRSLDQSADGRFTVFLSRSNNLVPTPTLGYIQVYQHDKDTGVITLVSQSSDGIVGNADSSSPKISANGRNVVFVSTASNLDEQVAIASGVSNVFTRDLVTEKTRILSVSARDNGASANANSFNPLIDNDGENIVFSSFANDLTATEKTQTSHLFHFSSSKNTIKVIPTSRGTWVASKEYSRISDSTLSANGEFVFYRLDVPGTSASLHCVNLKTLSQVNLNFDSNIDVRGSYIKSVSNNGSLALIAYADAQRSGLYDLVTHTFQDIGKWSNHTIPKALSADGDTVVFWSKDDLMPNNDIYEDVSGTHFIWDTQTNSLEESSRNILNLSGDGNVVLYSEQDISEPELVQLRSAQR